MSSWIPGFWTCEGESTPTLSRAERERDLRRKICRTKSAARILQAITGQDFSEDADCWREWWEQQ